MQPKELIEIEKIFGKTAQAGSYTLIQKCPICSGQYTFRFNGTKDLWECPDCKTHGTWEILIEMLSRHDGWQKVLAGRENPKPPTGLVLLSEWWSEKADNRVLTGFECLDRMIGGFESGMLTVITGKRGEGKSTFTSQLSANAAFYKVPVFFYTGELSVRLFRHWMYSQIAGASHLESYTEETGETRYRPSKYADEKISQWLGKNMILYDNSIVKSSEKNSIMERMKKARIYYGCGIYVIDNIMSAKNSISNERDYYRAQGNFVNELVDFAQENDSHIILVAHPRKSALGEEEDLNDNVSGSSDITNRASNVIRIVKLDEEKALKEGFDSVVHVTKNREYGSVGKLRFNFNRYTKRFEPLNGKYVADYGWEKEFTENA